MPVGAATGTATSPRSLTGTSVASVAPFLPLLGIASIVMAAGLALYIAWANQEYPVGSLSQPGPGYMPLLLAIFLGAMGVLIAFWGGHSRPLRDVHWPEAARAAISSAAYPDLDELWRDVGRVYQEEIRELAAAGCTYLQIDDTSFAYLCDDSMRAAMRARGDDPGALAVLYTRVLNDAIRDRPADMAVTVHTCRGNFKSSWVAAGGYEPVAETVLGGLAVDGIFMEFDSDRAGGFEPLRFVPDGRVVVLGLVTTKTPELEDPDDLRRRIDEAAKYVPLENLCLSPQCGFSSTHHGNAITEDDQKRKLALVVETAARVWG